MARKKEKQFEITMYKLLVVFAISLFAATLFGISMGKELGENKALENLNVPDYCHISMGDVDEVVCAEFGDFTADEMCEIFSTAAKQKLKVLFIN